MIIGLTGGIGSGKSTVAQIFRELGVFVLDSDQITRQLVAPNQPALDSIVHHFGSNILQPDGALNRVKLRSIIFSSEKERLWLEDLLHPLVKKQILRYADKIPKGHYLVVEIPLLVEAHFQDAVDRILVVDCAVDLQIDRVSQRDTTSRSDIQLIIDSQTSRANRLTEADDVVDNNSTRMELKRKTEALHHYYIELSK